MDEAAMTGQSDGKCEGQLFMASAHDRGADAGVPDAGVIVLIHGLGLTRATWAEQIVALSQHHDVLAYDLAGHGGSDLPSGTPDLTLYSTQLRHLLDRLDIGACHLVGFSLGGMINRRFAMDHPDRVLSLVILNSPHERSPESRHLLKNVPQTQKGAARGPPLMRRWRAGRQPSSLNAPMSLRLSAIGFWQ